MTFEEFFNYATTSTPMPPAPEGMTEADMMNMLRTSLRSSFDGMDTDGNGRIDRKEFFKGANDDHPEKDSKAEADHIWEHHVDNKKKGMTNEEFHDYAEDMMQKQNPEMDYETVRSMM